MPTNLTYDSGYVEWLLWTNMVTDNWFGLLVLLAVFMIAWVSISYSDKSQNALMGASFVSFIIGALLWLMGLLSIFWVVLMLIVVAISAFFGMKRDY